MDSEICIKLPEYVSVHELKRVCSELKIRDWTLLKETRVLPEEAERILAELEIGKMKISLEDFKLGL